MEPLEADKRASYIVRMCGRARLSTDYSETRIKLKFDSDYPAPNVRRKWHTISCALQKAMKGHLDLGEQVGLGS